MRQKGDNPIIDTSMIIRDNLEELNPLGNKDVTQINSSGEGLKFLEGKVPEERAKVKDILSRYFLDPVYQDNGDFIKVIAWRNKEVNRLNKIIRSILYGPKVDTFTEGEKLVANSPLFRQSRWGDYQVAHATSSEFVVTDVVTVDRNLTNTVMNAPNIGFKGKYWCLKTESGDDLWIVHADDRARYFDEAKRLKQRAIVERSKFTWIQYYTFLKWNDDIAYNYAITAHKSQGSTYDNVILFEEDLDKNPDIIERNRIKYTGYTRAKKRLYVLK